MQVSRRDPDDEKLLAEYLRVINEKDYEIHQLLVQIEEAHLELRVKEDKHNSKLKDLKKALEKLQLSLKEAGVREAELLRLKEANENLVKDINTLRSSLLKSDEKLRQILKINKKADNREQIFKEKLLSDFYQQRETLEKQLFSAATNNKVLQTQVESLNQRKEDAEKDIVRWKIESQKLQEECSDAHKALRELKRQIKDMKSSAAFESEMKEVEKNHKIELENAKKKIIEVQKVAQEEKSRANSFELSFTETRLRLDEMQRQMQLMRVSQQDNEMLIMKLRLEKAQTVEDQKSDYETQIKLFQQQVDKYSSEKVSLVAEVNAQRQRVSDIESATANASKRFRDDEQQFINEINALKKQIRTVTTDYETLFKQLSSTKEQVQSTELLLSDAKNSLKIGAQEGKKYEEIKMQNQNLTRSEQDLAQRLKEKEATLRENEQHINDLRDSISIMRNEMNAFKSNSSEKFSEVEAKYRLSDLELQSSRKINSEISSKYSALERNFTDTRKLLDELENRENKLKEMLKERDRTIETLHRDLQQALSKTQELQAEIAQDTELVSQLRNEKKMVNEHKFKLKSALEKKESELDGLNKEMKRVEIAAEQHTSEIQLQLEQSRKRVQALAIELHQTQQLLNVARVDASALETKNSEQVVMTRKNVVEPLQRQVEEMRLALSKADNDLASKDRLISEMKTQIQRHTELIEQLRGDIMSRDRRVSLLEDEREALKRVEVDFRKTQKELLNERENSQKVLLLEQQVNLLTKELYDAREREAAQSQELATRRSEAMTWRERCANLESLKNISDSAVEEYKRRETDMLDKIEEMHEAQVMMQTCFDKQQEQIDLGKKLIEN